MKVIKLKIKPSHYQCLNRRAVEANIAWNQLNEIYIGDVSFQFMKSSNGAKRAYDNDPASAAMNG